MWETWVRSLGWEDPLKKGKATQLQYSGLEDSMDYIVHGVTKSWTRLSNFHFPFQTEAQRGEVTCTGSHRFWTAMLFCSVEFHTLALVLGLRAHLILQVFIISEVG